MNAVEIEEAVSELALKPFEAEEFPFSFLEAFGNKSTTIKKLRSGTSNKTDVKGAILQRNNIHILTSKKGKVTESLEILRNSPSTQKSKVEFILATDGLDFQAENIITGETVVCEYKDFHNYFGFFLSLANITTVKQIRESAFDIKATSRLNKLYVELLQHNPDWATIERRPDMNHFLARLIFCFFAEDTDIFKDDNLFTDTIQKISDPDASNTHEVISEIFRAMDTKLENREKENIKVWGKKFPYVNGELFSGSTEVPKFTKIARSYLLHVGSLDWKQINPDIFGSMIQAVADEDERGSLGMHYTSVPNILKVLNPLFLDDLREQLEKAEDNSRKLLNLRNRMAHIRVFDPACGSGNFLVIAYKEMRKIENEINIKRGEINKASEIPLTNFRGIELKDFSAEVARLALIIAEYQCDVLYRGQRLALAEFLPLDAENWIVKGNALTLNWLSVCPPTGTGVKLQGDDLFSTPLNQAQIDFDNEGGETYICGNPPYKGSTWQTAEQKSDVKAIFENKTSSWKSLDYVACWFMKAAEYSEKTSCTTALVATNSICQGQQVPILWPLIFKTGQKIVFAHTSFKWANLASYNAGVTVIIVGISKENRIEKKLYDYNSDGQLYDKSVASINAYLVEGENVIVNNTRKPFDENSQMVWGNKPTDGGHLLLSKDEVEKLNLNTDQKARFIRRFYGSAEFIKGISRFCIWIEDENLDEAQSIPSIARRIEGVREMRLASKAASTRKYAEYSWKFRQIQGLANKHSIIVPAVSSEKRPYLPVGLLEKDAIIYAKAFTIYDAPLWNMALIASRLHWVWIGTVCVRLEMRFSYSNTLGWNTFPLPTLTKKNKEDLTACAEEILIARERHFPATIADLYDPEKMPKDLRLAHERNDEVLERIYIGRKFKNDTERLEKLFELYTKMTAKK
ncbi:DNA methyltransferase [Olleya sp. YS]|uniref:class I SAM-dependent DNA methyltransferase n=1 Tax=Olleya sp. YS TaxID=3028318 RepID=UPI0024344AC6|nr:DNA methyltransferase [Olleya sp. YS]WGD33942.1 lactate dehydrogenase [Olleya sp. YS]